MPQVSVILTSHNKENYIEETVQSVLNQRFKEFELIIVDDHSTDNTVQKINKIIRAGQNVSLHINEANMGANFCRNLGIKKSTGSYIIFVDGDDVLASHCIGSRVKVMEENQDLDFSIHTMQIFKEKIGDQNNNWVPSSSNPLRDFLAHDLPWQTMQPIWKKSVLQEVGGFDENFFRLQDVELHTRVLLKNKYRYKLVKMTPDCYYRIHEDRRRGDVTEFMKRWVTAALQYCEKFALLVPPGERKFLKGTVYQTYISLLICYKNKQISKNNFLALESSLISHDLLRESSSRTKTFFWIIGKYNMLPLRLPGFNRLLKKLLLR